MTERIDLPMCDGVRVLVVLNEREPREAVDWYRALDRLEGDGSVEAWSVYPFLGRRDAGVDDSGIMQEIADEMARLGATIVLWAHFSGSEVTDNLFERKSTRGGGVVHGYWDEDWYHLYRNPFPRETLRLCVKCDAVFVNGDGGLVRWLRRKGCDDIRFVPSTGDERFYVQPRRAQYDFDVVMIGSRIASRLPFRNMPGNLVRRGLVSAFSKRYGSRFVVFGHGWTGPNAMGPIPFASQSETYGQSIAALGNSNWFASYYFSNRLPIAMQSGRPVVHSCNDGYEEVFGSDSGVRWFRSVEEAMRLTDAVVNDPETAAIDIQKASKLSENHFTTYHAVGYMIRVLSQKQRMRGSTERSIANPWIRRDRL